MQRAHGGESGWGWGRGRDRVRSQQATKRPAIQNIHTVCFWNFPFSVFRGGGPWITETVGHRGFGRPRRRVWHQRPRILNVLTVLFRCRERWWCCLDSITQDLKQEFVFSQRLWLTDCVPHAQCPQTRAAGGLPTTDPVARLPSRLPAPSTAHPTWAAFLPLPTCVRTGRGAGTPREAGEQGKLGLRGWSLGSKAGTLRPPPSVDTGLATGVHG